MYLRLCVLAAFVVSFGWAAAASAQAGTGAAPEADAPTVTGADSEGATEPPTASTGTAPAAPGSTGDSASKPEDKNAAKKTVLLPPVDRSTPRQTMAGFLRAVEEGRLDRAALYLDGRGIRWGEQTPEQAAQQLATIIHRHVHLDLDKIADTRDGNPADGEDLEQVGELTIDGESIPIRLERYADPANPVWLISKTTVTRIPDLYAVYGKGSWLSERVAKDGWAEPVGLGLSIAKWQAAGLALMLLLSYPAGWLLGSFVSWLLGALLARTDVDWLKRVADSSRGPLRFASGWSLLSMGVDQLDLPLGWSRAIGVIATTPLIIAGGWFAARVVHGVIHSLTDRVPATPEEERHFRGLRTQLTMMRKLAVGAIILLTGAFVLLQFDVVKSIGVSLLASAGVAGVALGFAAQRSLGAVVGGIQLSLAQPLRIGDSVVLEGQWGQVEQINLTYVMVKLWDERRLVVPTDRIVTLPFENWSKAGTEIVGIVEFPVDATAPIADLRKLVEDFAKEHPLHDGREAQLQTIDWVGQQIVLRARVSTNDVDNVIQLRCELREALVSYLQERDGGRYLTRQRMQVLSGMSPLHGDGDSDEGPVSDKS